MRHVRVSHQRLLNVSFDLHRKRSSLFIYQSRQGVFGRSAQYQSISLIRIAAGHMVSATVDLFM